MASFGQTCKLKEQTQSTLVLLSIVTKEAKDGHQLQMCKLVSALFRKKWFLSVLGVFSKRNLIKS